MNRVREPHRPAVHIVVTCANRKRLPVPPRLRLSDLRERRPGPRFAAWTRRLAVEAPSAPVQDMYGGEHWQVARQLPTTGGLAAALWVCSAGYGLLASRTVIRPYAATFSAGVPDSVGPSRGEARDWWQRLTGWQGPDPDQPRSFADLALRNPEATIIAVLSDAYLRACAEDLVEAAGRLSDSDRFVVVGPPGRCAEVEDLLVPITARLRSVIGGSLQALHVRAAAHLLGSASDDLQPVTRSRLRQFAERVSDAAPANPSPAPGVRLTDDQVRDYVRASLATGPASATHLLRQLRQSGQSCEQSRFRGLFAQVRAEKVGP